jgi:hypothetical protein
VRLQDRMNAGSSLQDGGVARFSFRNLSLAASNVASVIL